MEYFYKYWFFSILYCLVQLVHRNRTRGLPGGIGVNPGLDGLMVIGLGWVIAPIDLFLEIKTYLKKRKSL